MATFFALILIGSAIALAAAAILGGRIRQAVADYGLALAALVAIGATAGSLYFSEGAGFVPCELCWYQRIAMYPLAPILAIATVRRDTDVARYVLPIAVVGAGLSIYHVQLQAFPDQGSACSLDAPCTAKWVEALGFVTIPVMALISFLLIIALTVAAFRHQPAPPSPEPESPSPVPRIEALT